LDQLPGTSDLLGDLNLCKLVRINFFEDFERRNPRFDAEAFEKLQKTTFGEG
jgi:hypothetical protein